MAPNVKSFASSSSAFARELSKKILSVSFSSFMTPSDAFIASQLCAGA